MKIKGRNELKRAEEELEQFNGVSVTEKKKAEESIRLGWYLVEERWENAITNLAVLGKRMRD